MEYQPQYFIYKDLVETGRQIVYTKDIKKENIDMHFNAIINIMKDGIETPWVQSMMINVIFEDDIDVNLSLFDYMYNVMMWQLRTAMNKPILSIHLFFPEDITRKVVKEYIDNVFVDRFRKSIPFIEMNQIIDSVVGKFRELRVFQLYLANSLNLEDTIELMEKYPEFNDTIHFSTEGIPIEDVKDKGMEATDLQIKYIKNSDHCLRDSFRTGEAISPKQYKEVAVNIGSKPDGQGGVFPHPIAHSFMNGGLQTPEEICVESSVGRVAQILQKTNVGKSGEFARQLELNNQDTFLHPDPDYVCDTQNFEEVTIDSPVKLGMYDLRYYRENPNGVDKLLEAKRDKHLIGKKLYFRSPMTCASAARGKGICYKCYGDLAYSNKEVNIGQIAAEGLSSIYTQILLSAKHLLESLVIKMNWPVKFYDMFKIEYSIIYLRDDMDFKNWYMIIDEEIKCEEEIDDIDYNYYINSFLLKNYQTDETIKIATEDLDNLYFVEDVYNFISNTKNKGVELGDNAEIIISMEALVPYESIFVIQVRNNELSRTMETINKLIDNKTVISEYDRNSILETFVNTNISGGIKLNAVHFEVLLMNQIRSIDDDLDMPDWSVPNQKYQIFTLSKSLANNKSITVRLESSNIAKALLNPNNDKAYKPSQSDLYFLEHPQDYLDPSIIADNNPVVSDKDENIVEPFKFADPNVRVGRAVKKPRMTKAEILKQKQ